MVEHFVFHLHRAFPDAAPTTFYTLRDSADMRTVKEGFSLLNELFVSPWPVGPHCQPEAARSSLVA